MFCCSPVARWMYAGLRGYRAHYMIAPFIIWWGFITACHHDQILQKLSWLIQSLSKETHKNRRALSYGMAVCYLINWTNIAMWLFNMWWEVCTLHPLLIYRNLNNLFTSIYCWAIEIWATCHFQPLLSLESEQPVTSILCWTVAIWTTCHLHPLLSYWNLNNLLFLCSAELLKSEQAVTCIPCWIIAIWTACHLYPPAELLQSEQSATYMPCWAIEI